MNEAIVELARDCGIKVFSFSNVAPINSKVKSPKKNGIYLKVLETDRLILRWLTLDDAEFVLRLLNEPSWLQFIGDKGVRTLEDARSYILKGPVEMYSRLGFGLYLVELKGEQRAKSKGRRAKGTAQEGVSIGMCGLLKRDSLQDVDIGFAFLPAYWGQGYAYEAAAVVMEYSGAVLGLDRIVAITSPDNDRSAKLLEKLGLRFKEMVKLSPDADQVRLFGPAS